MHGYYSKMDTLYETVSHNYESRTNNVDKVERSNYVSAIKVLRCKEVSLH